MSVLLLLLFVAFSATNTTTVSVGEQFSLENSSYELVSTFQEAAHVSTPIGGRLLLVDDCLTGSLEMVCLSSTTNVSATLSYFLLAELEEETSSAAAEEEEVVEEEGLVFSDVASVEVDYVEELVQGEVYNFSVSVSSSLADVEVTAWLWPPAGLEVIDEWVFGSSQGAYRFSRVLNNSVDAWVSYRVDALVTNPVQLLVEAEYNGTVYEQSFLYNVSAQGVPLVLNASFGEEALVVQERTNASVWLVNKNNFSVDASVSAASVLVDAESSLTVPANSSSEFAFSLYANRTGEYGVSVVASYVLFGQDLQVREFVPVATRELLNESVNTSQEDDDAEVVVSPLRISGPSLLAPNVSGELVLEGSGLGAVTVTWMRGEEVLSSQNLSLANASSTLTVSQPGRYSARVVAGNESFSESFVILSPASSNESVQEPGEELVREGAGEGSLRSAWLLAGLVLLVAVGGGLLVWRVRSTRFDADLMELYAVVLSWSPSSQQELLVREELLAELRVLLEQNS